ncbi:MAG: Crp/Fnr family transcriptional regulator [Myxococcales bacterium]|nr:Crp/Fnr family transcriptional regulator [Myxococcales bacterium]
MRAVSTVVRIRRDATPVASAAAPSAGEFLSGMPWFTALDEVERRRLTSETVVRILPAGAWLAREGDAPAFWYGVIEGLLKLCCHRQDGRSLTFTGVCAGSWFGEGTIFKREARRYDVIALQETHVACVPSAAFNRLLQTSFEFNHFVLELLNERCGQFIGRYIGQAMLNADAQVANALAGLFHPRLYPHMDAHLKISQEEVANLSGISRPRCNEALHRLKEAGLLRTEYGGITIVDLIGLHNFRG